MTTDNRTTDERCKGFWRMCGCEKCRAADRKLENLPPEDRKIVTDFADVFLLKRKQP